MKIALAIAPQVGDACADARAIAATATMMAATGGGHGIALLLPLQQPGLLLDIRHFLGDAAAAVLLTTYELPPMGKDPEASNQVRSLVWTRFLTDQHFDVLIVLHDVHQGALRCTSRLPGKAIAHVVLPGQPPVTRSPYRGIKPQVVLQAGGDDATILFDADTLRKVIEQSLPHLPASPAPPDRDASYALLVASLRKLRRPELELRALAAAIAFNEGPMKRRQLLLDVSVIVHGDARSGIQRVVRSLVVELLRAPPPGMDVKPIHFLGGTYRYANVFARTMKPTPHPESEDTLVDFRQGDTYLALDLNSHLVDLAAAAFADMQARGVSLAFVVYDILLIHHPEWWIEGTSAGFEKWLRSITTLADNLVCISDAVACDVKAWCASQTFARHGLPKVSSFHLGADVASSAPSLGMPPDAGATLEAIASRPSFLMVGTIEPRKGHQQALDAFDKLWTRCIACNLVIVGRSGWLVDDLIARLRKHPERGHRLFWLEGASDELLEEVYKASTCLIASSKGEGFGLPLVEAAQHGLPIIARALPVFREVAGDNVFYFDGLDAEDLASAVIAWLDLHVCDATPDSRNMRFLTWEASARQLIGAIASTSEENTDTWVAAAGNVSDQGVIT
ncbi:glycosyltransferase family 4 protein [Variovorax terrae]|uniref:Glycosyltransferase family 4 protein n=1 Tax=Variovorax terrae TaxID=2923278 RepID=A0A9X2APB8_9BURK|nr:glycosyltransferase family 1 protein [Variovorax terrae]MCJ0761871.1 glycosyltransferase family 4 protein [Variovorax terrae]